MHEWALAEAVVSAAQDVMRREGLRELSKVWVAVGELQQVDLEIFKFALSQLKRPILGDVEFLVESVPAEFRCRICSREWFFRSEKVDEDAAEAIHFIPEAAHAYVRCPGCGSSDFEVVGGRGVWLKCVEGS